MNQKDRYLFWMTKALNNFSNESEVYLFNKSKNILLALKTPEMEMIKQNRYIPKRYNEEVEITMLINDFKENKVEWEMIPVIPIEERNLFLENIISSQSEQTKIILNKIHTNLLFEPIMAKTLKELDIDSTVLWKLSIDIAAFMNKKMVAVEQKLGIDRERVVLWW